MTVRDTLPVLQDPEDAALRRREILESLHEQAKGGNIVAVAAIERMERDNRYISFIAGMDNDEDPAVTLEN